MTLKEYNNAVTLWADDVYRFAIHCSCDEDMGKDAVQEAYTALWEHRDSVNVEKVKSFLLTVVHNWVMSQHRHHKVHEDNAPDLIGEKVVAPDVSFDLRDALQKASAKLPEIQRSALILKDVEGYSCREIAEVLNISETQVSVYLFRARITMKKQLIALGYDNNNR